MHASECLFYTVQPEDMQRPVSMESLPSPEHPKPAGQSVSRSPLKPEFVQGGLNPSFVFLQLYFSHYYGRSEDRPILLPNQEVIGSGVNGKPVCRISFRLGRNDEIRKEYLSTGN